ncbi:MAG: CoA transferase [Novosphingobium sp.]
MKVLDLSCDVAGRFAARLFAWGGDEVVRIAPQLDEPESLTAYLDTAKQLATVADLPALLAECDLVFTSFDQGDWLGHARGLATPESCIHVTTSSFGTTGPYAAWRGGSMADWAAGGYLYITGDPDREPLSGPENTCAYAAGYTAAFGAEAALIGRMRDGRGRHLDISTMESMLLLHQSTFARTQAGDLRRRTGRFTEVYPLTVLPCRKGHVSLGVVSDAEFDKMAIAMGHPEWSLDPRFARAARWDHREELDTELARFLLQHDADEVVSILQEGGVACAKVAGARDIADNPQLAFRDYWEQAPGGGVMPGYPLRVFQPFGGEAPPPPLQGRGSGSGGCQDNSAHAGKPHPNPSPETQSSEAQREGLQDLPLSGIKVLDFTIFWAGPSAARTLADLGADVIWAEQPGSREDTVIEPGKAASPSDLMQHLYATKMYRGKRSIQLDLTRAEDRAVAHALSKEADIVLENYRPGVADKLGIGPAELSALNPGLVYVSLSGWGASGPWADWRSYGPSIEAASSIEGRTGYAGGDPLRLGHAFPDATGGLAGALAALRGLRLRLEGKSGGWFDVSQLEVYATLAGEGILEATRHGRGGELVGNASRFGALQGVFPCRGEDKWIALRLEGATDLARFEEITGVAPAQAGIAAWTGLQDKHYAAALLQQAGLEAFPALDAHELLADPQLAARGYFLDVAAGNRICKVPGTPLVATPHIADPSHPAPRPDEHSREIRKSIEALTP